MPGAYPAVTNITQVSLINDYQGQETVVLTGVTEGCPADVQTGVVGKLEVRTILEGYGITPNSWFYTSPEESRAALSSRWNYNSETHTCTGELAIVGYATQEATGPQSYIPEPDTRAAVQAHFGAGNAAALAAAEGYAPCGGGLCVQLATVVAMHEFFYPTSGQGADSRLTTRLGGYVQSETRIIPQTPWTGVQSSATGVQFIKWVEALVHFGSTVCCGESVPEQNFWVYWPVQGANGIKSIVPSLCGSEEAGSGSTNGAAGGYPRKPTPAEVASAKAYHDELIADMGFGEPSGQGERSSYTLLPGTSGPLVWIEDGEFRILADPMGDVTLAYWLGIFKEFVRWSTIIAVWYGMLDHATEWYKESLKVTAANNNNAGIFSEVPGIPWIVGLTKGTVIMASALAVLAAATAVIALLDFAPNLQDLWVQSAGTHLIATWLNAIFPVEAMLKCLALSINGWYIIRGGGMAAMAAAKMASQ